MVSTLTEPAPVRLLVTARSSHFRKQWRGRHHEGRFGTRVQKNWGFLFRTNQSCRQVGGFTSVSTSAASGPGDEVQQLRQAEVFPVRLILPSSGQSVVQTIWLSRDNSKNGDVHSFKKNNNSWTINRSYNKINNLRSIRSNNVFLLFIWIISLSKRVRGGKL